MLEMQGQERERNEEEKERRQRCNRVEEEKRKCYFSADPHETYLPTVERRPPPEPTPYVPVDQATFDVLVRRYAAAKAEFNMLPCMVDFPAPVRPEKLERLEDISDYHVAVEAWKAQRDVLVEAQEKVVDQFSKAKRALLVAIPGRSIWFRSGDLAVASHGSESGVPAIAIEPWSNRLKPVAEMHTDWHNEPWAWEGLQQ
jgi:hypothetical protein